MVHVSRLEVGGEEDPVGSLLELALDPLVDRSPLARGHVECPVSPVDDRVLNPGRIEDRLVVAQAPRDGPLGEQRDCLRHHVVAGHIGRSRSHDDSGSAELRLAYTVEVTRTTRAAEGQLEPLGHVWNVTFPNAPATCEKHLLADFMVKHAKPLVSFDLATAARDLAERSGADGLVLSGSRTGQPVDVALCDTIRQAVGAFPMWIGSGLDPDNAKELWPRCNGAIVGTWCKVDGHSTNAVDPKRAAILRAACVPG